MFLFCKLGLELANEINHSTLLLRSEICGFTFFAVIFMYSCIPSSLIWPSGRLLALKTFMTSLLSRLLCFQLFRFITKKNTFQVRDIELVKKRKSKGENEAIMNITTL